MADPIQTEAIVLRSMPYGEADRIMHVFTPGDGRRSVIARGARRAKSKLGGRLEPPSRVQLQLQPGRGDIATVTGVSTVAAYPRLRENLEAIDSALHACDDVDRLFGPGEANDRAYNLLANNLAGLDADVARATAPRRLAFRLKLLLVAGIAPQLTTCAVCGTSDPQAGFSGADGGMLCGQCVSSGFRTDPTLPGVLRDALERPLAQAPGGPAHVLRQYDRALSDLAQQHLGAKLRPLPLL